jgi:hypothetical protein
MWSRHTFSLTRLEPTTTGVGSPGAKNQKIRGVGRWREECGLGMNQGQTKKGQGRKDGESEGDRRI